MTTIINTMIRLGPVMAASPASQIRIRPDQSLSRVRLIADEAWPYVDVFDDGSERGYSWAYPPFVGLNVTTPDGYFGRPTGYAAYVRNERSSPVIVDADSVEVYIVGDSSPRGSRVVTAYPLNHLKD